LVDVTETAAVRRRPKRRLSAAFLLILPSIIYMLLLFAWPMVSGVLQAVRSPDGFSMVYINRMLADPGFWAAVRNTLLLIVVLLPIQFALALVMALLLQAKPKGQGIYFYLWAVPLAVSDLAAGLVWLSIFADRGYLNSVLDTFGIGPVSWLSYQNYTSMFLAVVIAELWRATSLVMVIVVSGMQGIPKDYDEAANVFGATYLQRLRHIWLPLLKPSLQVALILRTILAFQTFAVALQNPNVAAALALVVMAVSMLAAVVYLRVLREDTGGSKR